MKITLSSSPHKRALKLVKTFRKIFQVIETGHFCAATVEFTTYILGFMKIRIAPSGRKKSWRMSKRRKVGKN